MGDASQGTDGARGQHVAVLLACFRGTKTAARARRGVDGRLKSQGDALLDSVVARVDARRRGRVYDPRRVVQGTWTAALTWGVFGLVASGVSGLFVWAALGAICGGLYAYSSEHLLSKHELARIGSRLPPASSALLVFAKTGDPKAMLELTAADNPETASVVDVGDDLAARVLAGATAPVELPSAAAGGAGSVDEAVALILVRYAGPDTAKHVAASTAKGKAADGDAVQVELVISVDKNGRRHVADPQQGERAWAVSDVVSWGLFGVVVGAIAGAISGAHGGAVADAVRTGVGWAIFGLVAGALYGLWAGRAVSARRLKGLQGLLRPGTSLLVAWSVGAVPKKAVDELVEPGAQRLVLRFNPVPGGAVLEAA
jgi:uncharacterized membrane protein